MNWLIDWFNRSTVQVPLSSFTTAGNQKSRPGCSSSNSGGAAGTGTGTGTGTATGSEGGKSLEAAVKSCVRSLRDRVTSSVRSEAKTSGASGASGVDNVAFESSSLSVRMKSSRSEQLANLPVVSCATAGSPERTWRHPHRNSVLNGWNPHGGDALMLFIRFYYKCLSSAWRRGHRFLMILLRTG